VRCAGCGLVFIDPVPAAALSPATYGPDYYEPWQGAEETARFDLWRRRLLMVARRAPVGSLLDVGCADGLFLKVARDDGWSVEGIEFSPEGARRASLRLGRPVAVGDLTRDRLLRGPFDVVTLWHVLEHLSDPGAMLAAVFRRLRPGGLVAVAVPNLDNLPMQVAYRLARRRALPLYEARAREPHLSHFNPVTLSLALARHGFTEFEVLPDRCALTLAKRGIDAVAAWLGRLTGRLLTDAIVAFARRPR
jgi:SAM-dependent methyltransferase